MVLHDLAWHDVIPYDIIWTPDGDQIRKSRFILISIETQVKTYITPVCFVPLRFLFYSADMTAKMNILWQDAKQSPAQVH